MLNLKGYAVFGTLFTFAIAGFALPAGAQNYKASFSLPFAAHWGGADLQPGDYTITSTLSGSMTMLHVTGNGTTATLLTGPIELKNPSDERSKLELVDVNGTMVVTRFLASYAGKDYSFQIPKSIAHQGMGAVALKKAVIPVSN